MSDLLADARRLLTAPDAAAWSRAAALLARQALERDVAIRLSKRGCDPGTASFTVQLLVLAEVVEPAIATRAAWAWAGLSHATHHHGYELPATVDELEGWFAAVEALLVAKGR